MQNRDQKKSIKMFGILFDGLGKSIFHLPSKNVQKNVVNCTYHEIQIATNHPL